MPSLLLPGPSGRSGGCSSSGSWSCSLRRGGSPPLSLSCPRDLLGRCHWSDAGAVGHHHGDRRVPLRGLPLPRRTHQRAPARRCALDPRLSADESKGGGLGPHLRALRHARRGRVRAARAVVPRRPRGAVAHRGHVRIPRMSGVLTPTYEAITGWEQLPAGYTHPDVAAVAVNSIGRVYLFCRAEHPVLVYERDGRFVGSWGEGIFSMRTHGITIAPDDSVWCVDDAGHSVRKFTPDGKLLLSLGDNGGKPSDSGYDGSNITTIARGAPPFNRPTNLAIAPNGDLYVSD